MALDAHEYSAVVKSRGGKLQPDMINSIALKNLTREQAEAEGWTTYYVPQPCAAGHVAARYVKNDLCVSCWLVRQGRDPLYPTAKNRTYYKQRDPAAAVTASGAPAVTPAAPLEPSKPEQNFLAQLATLKGIDRACAAVPGWSRGLVESRCSSNPIFRAAFQDMCDRLGIATRAPDANAFAWSPELERAFTRRWVDVGLLEQARTELGISASTYHEHLAASPAFQSLISAAEPLARFTLRDRATQEAARGNDKLLRQLEAEAPELIGNMSAAQCNAEIQKLLQRFDKMGLFPNEMRHKITGQLINYSDLEYAQDSSNGDVVS